MDSSKLSRTQADRLHTRLGPHLTFLTKLVQRMDDLGFDPTDRLYLAALRARDELTKVHRQSEILAGKVKHKRGKGENQTPRAPWLKRPVE